MRWAGGVACLLLSVVAVSGCQDRGTAGQESTQISVPEAVKVLQQARFDKESSLRMVDRLRGADLGVEAARRLLQDKATQGAPRWAAAYLYADGGKDAAVLKPLLSDGSTSVRAMASGGLAELGDSAGFPVLVELTAKQEWMAAAVPPRRVADFSEVVLREVTGRSDLKGSVAWQDWWKQHQANLQWNQGQKKWTGA